MHQDGGSFRIDVEGDAGFMQRRTDARSVLRFQSRIERFVLGRLK